MTQILVTGMHRSGTTLCFDLIRRHQVIEAAINESVLFERSTGQLIKPPFPSKQLEASSARPGARAGNTTSVEFQDDPHNMTWISKMSYPGPLILQEWCRRAVDYTSAWLDEFGSSARVIHMVRHPFAIYASMNRRWGSDPIHLTNYGPITLDGVCRDWAVSVTEIENAFKDDHRLVTLMYEKLVTEAERVLIGAFKHCDMMIEKPQIAAILEQDLAFFGRVESSRANAHRETSTSPISRSTSWLLTPLFEKWGYWDL